MPQPDTTRDRIRLAFDGYVIDVARRELRRGSRPVAIEPQVFDFLLYLARNPDRLIDRDELLRAIWHGRIVSDSAITNRITAARRAIGDSGEAQRLIRTVPRRGICFIGRVEELPGEIAVSSLRSRFRRPMWLLAGGALLAACIALIVAWPIFRAETGALPRVLVSALSVKTPGAGANDPGLAPIAVGEPALSRDSLLLRPIARPAPVATKPNPDVVAAALPAGTVRPATAEPEQKVPLPDVTVSTPAPIRHLNRFSVDEAKWSVIPCTDARIDLGPGAKCQVGMPVPTGGLCDITRQVAMVTNARYEVEADVMIFDPMKVTAAGYQGKNCTVWRGYTNMPDDFQDMNQMTRRGGGWANFVKGDPQSTVSFVDHGRYCIAVERLGPPWHGGHVWVVHASICPAAGGAVQNADIDAIFATLQLRTYDAQGNLRAQSQ